MSNQGPFLDVYNLAWAPFADGDAVDIYDRHNGVPTLGVVTAAGKRTLFWQCADLGSATIWVYVPLDMAEVHQLEQAEDGEVLDGIVLGLLKPRFATIGIAGPDNRLAFEREWYIPVQLTEENAFHAILRYIAETIVVAMETDLPASRRDIVQHASDAARELVSC